MSSNNTKCDNLQRISTRQKFGDTNSLLHSNLTLRPGWIVPKASEDWLLSNWYPLTITVFFMVGKYKLLTRMTCHIVRAFV